MEQKIAFLKSLSEMLERKTTSPEESTTLMTIFDSIEAQLGDSFGSLCLTFLKKPFWELREATYIVVKGTCRYGWGIMKLLKAAGLFEFFLNRNSEIEYQGSEWKFVTLQTLVGHPKAKELLGLQMYHDCLEYLRHGIHYKPTEAATILKDETM